MTTYNRPDALALVLASLERQRVLPDQAIVADDGSGPETAEVVDRFRERLRCPLHHVWHEDTGFRLAAIRNRAIAAASGNYLVMIDGDVVMHREFIREHRRFARRGRYVQGSRAMLGERCARMAMVSGRTTFSPFSGGMTNRLNALYFPALSALVSTRQDPYWGTRGCHMAFWRDDVLRINGFNEDFVGWGREDSEFAARLIHSGVERRNFKFAAIAYHLHHPAAECASVVARNHAIYEACVASRNRTCENGVSKYLSSNDVPHGTSGRAGGGSTDKALEAQVSSAG